MKPVITAACLCLAAYTGSAPLFAQLQNNTEKQMTCSDRNNDGDQKRHCEIREQTVPGVGRLTVDAGQNGGATVKGWLRNDVLVRARIEATADTESAAAGLVTQVLVDSSGGQVRAMGPAQPNNTSRERNSNWSVSYEIFVPQSTDLNIKTVNGGLNISDIRGQLHFGATNGGVNLKRVAGEVTGETVNGGIQAELTGAPSDLRQVELTTKNGGVTVAMPSTYSAHFKTETGNGGIHSDFPSPAQTGTRARTMDFNVGSGGPLIHITTGNGGINLKRAEATR